MADAHPIASTEKWLSIAGCPGYEISDHGRIRSRIKRGCRPGMTDTPKLLTPITGGAGYLAIIMCPPGCARRREYIHRLVLEAFVGPCPEGLECRHLDGDPRNNRLDNLVWGTGSENSLDKYGHGTMLHGEAAPWSKFSDETIREIRELKGVRSRDSIARQYDISASYVHAIWSGTKRRTT